MSRLNRRSALTGINRRMAGWLLMCLVLPAWADEDDARPRQPADGEAGSGRQPQRMQRRAASLSMKQGETKVDLIETAALRYSSPGSTTDGAVWVWGQAGRPLALSAIFYEQLAKGEEKWSCELTSLAEKPVALTARAGWKWTPATSEVRWLPIADAPAVALAANQRLRQMKELARDFAASAKYDTETEQLRLLIQPLHRYSDPANELLDGALFAFASGTNPEVLLLLEARGEPDKAQWQFAFARMGAADCWARRDEKVVWEVPAIKSWNSKEAYYSMFGKDLAVFGKVNDDD